MNKIYADARLDAAPLSASLCALPFQQQAAGRAIAAIQGSWSWSSHSQPAIWYRDLTRRSSGRYSIGMPCISAKLRISADLLGSKNLDHIEMVAQVRRP
jgi:hypothetical protein